MDRTQRSVVRIASIWRRELKRRERLASPASDNQAGPPCASAFWLMFLKTKLMKPR